MLPALANAVQNMTVTISTLSKLFTTIVTLVRLLFLVDQDVVLTVAQFFELVIALEAAQNLIHSASLFVETIGSG